jgi:hypothetical protein
MLPTDRPVGNCKLQLSASTNAASGAVSEPALPGIHYFEKDWLAAIVFVAKSLASS